MKNVLSSRIIYLLLFLFVVQPLYAAVQEPMQTSDRELVPPSSVATVPRRKNFPSGGTAPPGVASGPAVCADPNWGVLCDALPVLQQSIDLSAMGSYAAGEIARDSHHDRFA